VKEDCVVNQVGKAILTFLMILTFKMIKIQNNSLGSFLKHIFKHLKTFEGKKPKMLLTHLIKKKMPKTNTYAGIFRKKKKP